MTLPPQPSAFGNIVAPRVSVIVVNYNYGRFISDCLRSILDQSYPNIECIVIDNASSDDSLEHLENFIASEEFSRDGRSLKVLKSDVNLYQTPAAAKAFKQSTGKFIIFFDADDYMLPTCVETHIQAMLSLRFPVGATCVDYFMSSGDELIVSASGYGFSDYVLSRAGQRTEFSRNVDLPHTGLDASLDLKPSELHLVDRQLAQWPWSGTCGLCFRREMIDLMFSRVPNLREQLDSYLIWGVNSLTGSVLIDRPLVVYRYHGANAFALGPNLAQFVNCDRDRQRQAEQTVALEVMATFVANAEWLQKYLAWSVVFIEALECLARLGNLRAAGGRRISFMLEFLIANESRLRPVFDKTTYDYWLKRARSPLREWFAFKFWRAKITRASRSDQRPD